MYVVVGFVRLCYEWDWSGADDAFRRALELNPNYAWVHGNWSDLLLVMGRYEQAITEAQLGMELDPLSVSLIFNLGQKLSYRRDYDRALEQLRKALELDPNFVWAHVILAQVYAWRGRYDEGLASCEKVASLSGDKPYSRALRSLILGMAGKTDEAKKMVNELKAHPKLDTASIVYLAQACSVMDDKSEAFEFLEAAYKERASLLIYIGVKQTYENIRSDSRFADLLRRMGLPQVPFPTPS